MVCGIHELDFRITTKSRNPGRRRNQRGDVSLWESESEVAQSVQFFATPWTIAHQAPPSMGFSRQEGWSGLPCPSPGDLPNPGIEPGSPTCRQFLYQLSHQGSPVLTWCLVYLRNHIQLLWSVLLWASQYLVFISKQVNHFPRVS